MTLQIPWSRRRITQIISISALFLCVYYLWSDIEWRHKRNKILADSKFKVAPIILDYTGYWRRAEDDWPVLRRLLCPHLKCTFTNDRDYYNVADGVMFFKAGPNAMKPSHPNQYHILFHGESPQTIPALQLFHSRYNLTMTYRLDSDIFSRSFMLRKWNDKDRMLMEAKANGKRF